jgi:hypothetical protein
VKLPETGVEVDSPAGGTVAAGSCVGSGYRGVLEPPTNWPSLGAA